MDLGRWWRFIVLGDPTVRRFGIRDLDMFLLDRERDAVRAWEEDGTKQVERRRKKEKYLALSDKIYLSFTS